LTVTDPNSGLYSTTTLIVNVYSTPTIVPVPLTDQIVTMGSTTTALSFIVSDSITPAGSLKIAGTSSNTTLVPNANANITLSGPDAGGNCSVTVTPALHTGTTTITLTVTNGGGLTASTSFVLTVYKAPSFTTTPASQNLKVGAKSAALLYTVFGTVTPLGNLVVTGSSSNTAVVPAANIAITQPNNTTGNGYVTVTAAGAGTSTITLTVTDPNSGLSSTTTFNVTAS
jgi:hypothetical protein